MVTHFSDKDISLKLMGYILELRAVKSLRFPTHRPGKLKAKLAAEHRWVSHIVEDVEIIQQEHPNEEETNFVYGQLRASNKVYTGELPYKSLHLFAYGPEHQVVGGLFGEAGWGWLHIDILWVDSDYRGRGLGAQLLEQAEAESLALGINRGYLETTSFQARPFYEKMGYEVFAQLEDQPPGHTCFYMKKRFG